MPSLGRLAFSAVGAAAYYASGFLYSEVPRRSQNPGQVSQVSDASPTYILPAFWYAPDRRTAVREIQDMKRRLGVGNGGFRLGVSVFVRHMGDVAGKEKDYHYDKSSLEAFLDVCVQEGMPVFINTSGVQWTEVAYRESPLIQMLMENVENRVILKTSDGKIPAPRKRQLGFQDRNGLSYLCMYSPNEPPHVQYYWDRNLRQLADVVSAFASQNPCLFVGMSTENETDLPGKWAGGGFDSDYNSHFIGEYKAAQHEGNNISWHDFRVLSVRLRNMHSANKLLAAGIPREKIYTHVSTEDDKTRASPLEVGIVGSAGNLGVVWWGKGKFPPDSLAEAQNAAVGAGSEYGKMSCKGFGILAANPLSFSRGASMAFLEEAIRLGANPIVPYCWWPYFTGYGIKGLGFERAARHC